jgi:hypothetical protein
LCSDAWFAGATETVQDLLKTVDAKSRSEPWELNGVNFARSDAKVEQRFAEQDARIERRFAQVEARKRFID